MKVLVISQSYQPISTIPWEKAMCLVFREKAEVLAHYEGVSVRSASSTHNVPAVVRLASQVRRVNRHVKFSRENVFIRDRHTCQYCGSRRRSHLTFDHVVPRALGGKTNWLNIVTACQKCNSKKADRSLHEVGMKLMSEPRMPAISENHTFLTAQERIPSEWMFWLGHSNDANFSD
jgi:5-methylcytosine-specific restriction endonuclease McrA